MNPSQAKSPARFVVITGLSGSGKSTALKALEDLGYYAVDNLPVELLPAFVKLPLSSLDKPFHAALGMDVRARSFVDHFPDTYLRLASGGHRLELLFLEANGEVLIRRYSETRRKPPLSEPGESVRMGLERERELMAPIRNMAHQIIDTSRFTIHDLRQEVLSLYRRDGEQALLQLNLLSFGFKHGLPQEADLVMDVRFLDNPHFVDGLRELDGRDPRVVDFVFQDGTAEDFLTRFKSLLEFLLPRYQQEGKTRLTVALGCTGGHHRSVAVVEWLARELNIPGVGLTVRHRDVTLD
ncbi:MAG: RNase adapter RapZ [Desulfarculaceae bacterium]|nr:RNase adapter RapZ [Desulfarculaceae bacterium]MCF8072318.1 RNase adapter RapZ [Desulfarculaceae bacterium]MCF8100239.1 RNase adapter RapZ [Desulfarculaceae bacterium]MCF8116188.1 RNase adapter RapZ [Desulfarculaceae bacterium]